MPSTVANPEGTKGSRGGGESAFMELTEVHEQLCAGGRGDFRDQVALEAGLEGLVERTR